MWVWEWVRVRVWEWEWVRVWLVELVPSPEKQGLPHPGPASLRLPGDHPVLPFLLVPRPILQASAQQLLCLPLCPSLRSGPGAR